MYALVLMTLLGADPAPAADTVMVCPRDMLLAMQPWVLYRRQQGREIAYVPSEQTPEAIRDEIRTIARDGRLRWILLVGDAESAEARNAGTARRGTPTHWAPAKVNVKWGSEPEIATDNWYADLDDDHTPDVAVGRLPVDSARELSTLIKRIQAYEQSTDFGPWRQRVNFVAGVGGFGALVDTILETATKKFLTEGIPTSFQTSMTYGSWRSPYCPDPRNFQRAALERFNEGCLFWVYIGHGHPLQLDRIKVPGGQFPILTVADAHRLQGRANPPIAVMLACYTGAFDMPRDCLAEEMMRSDGGPIAVLAGSRVTMPYAMAVLGHGLMEEVFRQHGETLGEVMLKAKQRMMQDEVDDGHRQLLDAIAAAISPSKEQLVEERREHLHLFNLLGDPLLRLKHPGEITVAAPTDAEAGAEFDVTAQCPLAGRCVVELVCKRDRFKQDVKSRSTFDGSADVLARFDEQYRSANDRRWDACVVELDAPGEIRAKLKVPAGASGPCHVIVYAEGAEGHALGSANVFVRRAKATPAVTIGSILDTNGTREGSSR